MIDKLQQLGHLGRIALGILARKKTFCGPLWVQIGVSNRCNYRCVMCWDHPSFVAEDDPYPDRITSDFFKENPSVDRSRDLMDMDLFRKIIVDLHEVGTRRVELVGRGEPFLNRHLAEMVSFAKSKNMYCSIATNGSLLTADITERLIREGLDRIIVSVNAGRPETYGKIHATEDASGFHKVKESLLRLRQLKSRLGADNPFLTMSFALSSPNSKEAVDMVALAREAGAAQIIFKHAILYDGIRFLDLPDQEKIRLDRELMELEEHAERDGIDMKMEPPIGDFVERAGQPPAPMEIYDKIPCYVGWLFSLITADGTVLPCCHCFALMGNVKSQSFKQIWRSEAFSAFRADSIGLPERKAIVPNCRCDLCAYTKLNISLYNHLHPFNKRTLSEGQREFRIAQLLSSLSSKKVTRGQKRVTTKSQNEKKERP